MDGDVEVLPEPVESFPDAGVGGVGEEDDVALFPGQGLCQAVDAVGGVVDDVYVFGGALDLFGDVLPRLIDEFF